MFFSGGEGGQSSLCGAEERPCSGNITMRSEQHLTYRGAKRYYACFEVNDIQSVVEYKVLLYRTDIEGDVGSNSYKYIFMAAQVTTIEVVQYTTENV